MVVVLKYQNGCHGEDADLFSVAPEGNANYNQWVKILAKH